MSSSPVAVTKNISLSRASHETCGTKLIKCKALHCVKCPNTELILVRIFLYSDWIRRDTEYLSEFSPNTEKYGPEITPYLDTFHVVLETTKACWSLVGLIFVLLIIFQHISYIFFFKYFNYLKFTSYKVEEALTGMKLQEKKEDNNKKHIEKLIRKNPILGTF